MRKHSTKIDKEALHSKEKICNQHTHVKISNISKRKQMKHFFALNFYCVVVTMNAMFDVNIKCHVHW